jgi:DNA-binding transcriptional LysR family regulator
MLFRDPLLAVLPEGHPLAARRAIRLADLDGVPMAAPRADRAARSHRALVERLLADAGVKPHIAFEVDDLPAAQALARAGLAVVLMHGLTIPDRHPGIAVRPLRGGDEGARTIEVASLEGRRWPPADAMAGILLERLQEQRT